MVATSAPSAPDLPAPGRRPQRRLVWLHTAGVLSLGAGAVHAAAIGAHAEHPAAVQAFAVLAVLQLGVGAAALAASNPIRERWSAVATVAVSAAAAFGWILAKTSGIGFIDGLGDAESIQFADGLAAAMAFLAIDTAAVHLVRFRRSVNTDPAPEQPVKAAAPSRASSALVGMGIAAAAILTTSAMNSASTHRHEGAGHGDEHAGEHAETAHSHDGGDEGHHNEEPAPAAAVAPVPYDPTKPIDLGGVEGVTPEQQARAENLVALTLAKLPQFGDPNTLEARGYYSIRDASTGHEHFVNWKAIDDGRLLDPDAPESVVFEAQPDGSKKLVSAMFFAETGTTLDNVPDIGGPLTQWHIHNNLCYADDPPVVAGLTNSDGTCRPGTRTLGEPRPMIHVWITPHRCGPFSALDGVGAGQVKPGESTNCDHAHGDHN